MNINDLANRITSLVTAAALAGCKLHAIEIPKAEFAEAIHSLDVKLHADKLPMWSSKLYPDRLHFLCCGVVVFPKGA